MVDKINRKKNTKFAQISNKVLYDDRLSYKARGIFSYLWAKPEDWKVLVKNDLVKNGKESEYSIRQALHELRQYGYLVWKRLYKLVEENPQGKGKKLITGIEYFLDDEGGYPLHCDHQNEDGLDEDGLDEDGRNVYINKDKKNKDINKKDCIAEQSNFSQNETLVLTQENFEAKWFEFIKKEPKAGFEAKYDTFKQNWFAKSKGKNKNDYKNWEAYFKEDWIKHEFNLDPALDPVKIAEQEALEREKRLEEMRSEKEKVEKYFAKNEYDANLTNVFQEKVKETRGENTLKQIEDVKVVEFNKEKRCIVLSGSEASRNMIYSFYTAWINKLKLGVSFNKIYCLTLEELKKYKQKELDLNEITTII